MQPPFPSAEFIRARLAAARQRRRLPEGYRHAAVLIPLVASDNDWHVVLTRRNSDLPRHRGQIAFPGGSTDEGEDCMRTALREAAEEIGLDPETVRVLGCHEDIWTPSGFVISPVVGVLGSTEGLQPNPAEVARLFTVPLSFFANESNAHRQTMRHDGIDREVFFYQWDGETIWGATALMLRNLLGLLDMIEDAGQAIA